MKDLLEKQPSKVVFLRADSRSKYELVEDVVDNLRAAGVDQLGLLTEQVQDNKRKPASTGAM